MATSIISPAVSGAHAHSASARLYNRLAILGCWSDPDAAVFEFQRRDGGSDRFTPAEMNAADWWHELPPDVTRMIQANLVPAYKFPSDEVCHV